MKPQPITPNIARLLTPEQRAELGVPEPKPVRRPARAPFTKPPAVPADFTIAAWQERGLPAAVAEYRFHPTRRWRFDFAFPAHLVAVEVEGGIWTQGRHTRGAGFIKDIEKYNAGAAMGWRILRCVTGDERKMEFILQLADAIDFHSAAGCPDVPAPVCAPRTRIREDAPPEKPVCRSSDKPANLNNQPEDKR